MTCQVSCPHIIVQRHCLQVRPCGPTDMYTEKRKQHNSHSPDLKCNSTMNTVFPGPAGPALQTPSYLEFSKPMKEAKRETMCQVTDLIKEKNGFQKNIGHWSHLLKNGIFHQSLLRATSSRQLSPPHAKPISACMLPKSRRHLHLAQPRGPVAQHVHKTVRKVQPEMGRPIMLSSLQSWFNLSSAQMQ